VERRGTEAKERKESRRKGSSEYGERNESKKRSGTMFQGRTVESHSEIAPFKGRNKGERKQMADLYANGRRWKRTIGEKKRVKDEKAAERNRGEEGVKPLAQVAFVAAGGLFNLEQDSSKGKKPAPLKHKGRGRSVAAKRDS